MDDLFNYLLLLEWHYCYHFISHIMEKTKVYMIRRYVNNHITANLKIILCLLSYFSELDHSFPHPPTPHSPHLPPLRTYHYSCLIFLGKHSSSLIFLLCITLTLYRKIRNSLTLWFEDSLRYLKIYLLLIG